MIDKICNITLTIPKTPTLIMDLLAGRGKAMDVQSICRAGALMGVRETTMRVGLTRLKEAGKVLNIGRGLYKIAPAAHPLHETVNQWHRKRALSTRWVHGHWVAVHDSDVPKSSRTEYRHHLLALTLLGFAELRTNLHIRPDNFIGGVQEQQKQLEALGLSKRALCFKLCQLEKCFEVEARALWNVDQLVRADQEFLAALEVSGSGLDRKPLDTAVRESLLLGRTVIAHLVRDPVLPRELMPEKVRERLLEQMIAYQAHARKLWNEWLEQVARESAA